MIGGALMHLDGGWLPIVACLGGIGVGAAACLGAARLRLAGRRALAAARKLRRHKSRAACHFCGHARVARFCARCGRDASLVPPRTPAPYAGLPSAGQAPGLHANRRPSGGKGLRP